MDQPSAAEPASDEETLAYMQSQLRSGRVKPAVLVLLTQKAFAEVSHERIWSVSTAWIRAVQALAGWVNAH